jgi:hypothetical protein
MFQGQYALISQTNVVFVKFLFLSDKEISHDGHLTRQNKAGNIGRL